MKKILVAFDGSPQSYKAFDFAMDMVGLCSQAKDLHEIVVVSVAQPPELSEIVEMEAVIDKANEYYKALHEELKKKAQERNLQVKTEILVGHPADQLVRYANENMADMVVMGQRGKSGISGWLMGSVSKRVTTYAPCTVVVVK